MSASKVLNMSLRGNKAIWEAETFGEQMIDVTVGDLLDRQAEAAPDKEALVYRYPEIGLNLRLTYAGMRDEANRVARGLMALGIRLGDHVALLASNLPEWVLLEMALAKVGAVLVTVNTNFRQAELEYVLGQADVHTLVLMDEYRGNDYVRSLKALLPELDGVTDPVTETVTSARFPTFRRAVLLGERQHPGLLPFSRLRELSVVVSDEALAERQAAVTPRHAFQIQFTSGTTGAPKGAIITHHGTVNNARFVARRARFGADDRWLSAMPLFHTAGSVVDQLSMLVSGGTVVRAIAFEGAKMLELIDREKATVLNAVPTMIIAMLHEPRLQAREFETGSLRCVLTAGTPIPVPLMEQVKARWGAEPAIMFGMTEASPIITQTLPDDSFELRSSTVGIPLPYTEVKIVDANGDVVDVGRPGEILVRGYNVMRGYYRMPEQTAAAIDADGWLHTGDVASMDERGYVRIVGRIKDMIIRGGENVYPAEVEAFLMRHPSVRQAQVVGVPDSYMGEEAVAVLQLKEGEALTEDEVRGYCRAALARHKVPKYVRFVSEYPQTPSGKVKKFELRAAMIAALGLDAVGR
jgi:fatty-acyl-CoA synthase